ncbi:MAG TPA: serine/threonine-protein kinase [Chthoniobacterales bacterium]|nr:serine/threonine-protein kinase [Chthoniobacterales bacterium]
MEPTTFFDHYRICTGEESREVSRTGAAINYKAIDTRSHEPVRLQLIPKSAIEPEKLTQLKERVETAEKLDHVNIAKTLVVGVESDYFAIVSEYFEGETADSWIVENGPMAADAALRAGLQIVRALGAAAFFNLTHRAIQPSNLMIVPGESPSGGWPFIKLLNFGLAGLDLHSDSSEAAEIAPTTLPQFASPEQRNGGEINFESEMYSLGATICFLLTGAAPLAVTGMKARLRIRRLPELRRAPKSLHNLLVSLLRENPENRPHDPVALEKEMQECLSKVERRQAIGRKLGISLASVVPRKPKAQQPVSPLGQVLRGVAAVVVLLIAGAAAAEYLFQDKVPYLRRTEKIGVPIGVPDATKLASAPTASPVAVNQPIENSTTTTNANANANANANQKSTADQNQPATASERPSPLTVASNEQDSSTTKPSEPASPGSGPENQPSAPENPEQSSEAESTESETMTKKRPVTSNRESTIQTPRISRTERDAGSSARGPAYDGRGRARIIGRTPDGRPVVKLTSGRVVILPRHYDDNGIYPSRARRRAYNNRADDDFVPPSQPFNRTYDPNE